MKRAARFAEQRLSGNPRRISKVESEGPGIPKVQSLETGPSIQPHLAKVEHFLQLGLFDSLENNEWQVKIQLRKGTYNPDFYHRPTDTYVEVVTSVPNVSEQRRKWREAMRLVKLRIFWWEGLEITEKIRKGSLLGKLGKS